MLGILDRPRHLVRAWRNIGTLGADGEWVEMEDKKDDVSAKHGVGLGGAEMKVKGVRGDIIYS